MSIAPDTKDWTWVLERRCPECGLDASALDLSELPRRIVDNAERWSAALSADGAVTRPTDGRWSTLEYGCHVRDVHVLFTDRARAMLTQDDPAFANWDQDATAIEDDYAGQRPADVAEALGAAAAVAAEQFAAVSGDQWRRPGTRSNGSVFTVGTLARYYLHDIEHHLWDVTGRQAG